ncbi:MAG TPA: hypothetical protein VIX63_15315 [Vicinamibacterales bacterium]
MTFGRLLGFGVASLAVLSVLSLAMLLRPDPQLQTPGATGASTLARTLNKTARDRADTPDIGWVVTKATSAQSMMVVEVDAERLDDAGGIAIQIVEPVRSRGYDEILVYVRQPGSRTRTVRRIQWTPGGGYVESTYADR